MRRTSNKHMVFAEILVNPRYLCIYEGELELKFNKGDSFKLHAPCVEES